MFRLGWWLPFTCSLLLLPFWDLKLGFNKCFILRQFLSTFAFYSHTPSRHSFGSPLLLWKIHVNKCTLFNSCRYVLLSYMSISIPTRDKPSESDYGVKTADVVQRVKSNQTLFSAWDPTLFGKHYKEIPTAKGFGDNFAIIKTRGRPNVRPNFLLCNFILSILVTAFLAYENEEGLECHLFAHDCLNFGTKSWPLVLGGLINPRCSRRYTDIQSTSEGPPVLHPRSMKQRTFTQGLSINILVDKIL